MSRKYTFLFALLIVLGFAAAAYAQSMDDRQAVNDIRGGIVRNTTGNCVRMKWMTQGDICSPEPPPAPKPVVEVKPPPQPMKKTIVSEADRTIYFPFNKTALTDEAKAHLDTLAETLKGASDIKEAKIVGAADRIGSTGYNDKLSEKRAENVRDYLVARGYTNASVTKTSWVGKSEPITSCAPKMPRKKLIECLNKDRRVQIDIVYRSVVMVRPEYLNPATNPAMAPASGKSTAVPIVPAR